MPHGAPGGRGVLLGGGGVERGGAVEERSQGGGGADVHRLGQPVMGLERAVVEHAAFAGRGQDDELVAELAADRAGVGHHRDRLDAQALEGAHVGQHHAVVARHRRAVVDVEAVGVLHQELAAAHDAEPRTHLVAELPLDVVEHLRQLAIRFHRLAEQVGDHLLVGGPVEQVALVPVADAQHLRAVGVVAAAAAPQLGRLHGGHQQLLGADRVLLLAHHLCDAPQHAQARRQPGIDAGRGLAHQPGTEHQPVRGDLRLGRGLLQGRQEAAGQAHRGAGSSAGAPGP